MTWKVISDIVQKKKKCTPLWEDVAPLLWIRKRVYFNLYLPPPPSTLMQHTRRATFYMEDLVKASATPLLTLLSRSEWLASHWHPPLDSWQCESGHQSLCSPYSSDINQVLKALSSISLCFLWKIGASSPFCEVGYTTAIQQLFLSQKRKKIPQSDPIILTLLYPWGRAMLIKLCWPLLLQVELRWSAPHFGMWK